MGNWHYLCSPLKAAEGGIAQSTVRVICQEAGVRVRFSPSCYVGLYDVAIDTRNKRTHRRLAKAIGANIISQEAAS